MWRIQWTEPQHDDERSDKVRTQFDEQIELLPGQISQAFTEYNHFY